MTHHRVHDGGADLRGRAPATRPAEPRRGPLRRAGLLAAGLALAIGSAIPGADPATATGASGQDGRPLAGNELRRAIAGKRVYLAVPLGGEFPLYYRPDGRVDGSGETVGLGRFLKPTDSGRWWVDGSRLCQQWQSWYSGKVFCFTVSEHGPGRIAWERDDGEKGIARLAE